MRAKAILSFIFSLWYTHSYAQTASNAFQSSSDNTIVNRSEAKVTLSGYIRDAADGEALIGVSVYIKELQTGTISNTYGFFSLSIPEGNYTLTFSYIGYQSQTQEVELRQNQTLSVELVTEDVALEEIIISADRPDANVEKVEMSTNVVSMTEVKQIPQLLGEVDVIRSIQLLPGITTVGEGATGFNVRGGNIDENLILLDEAPVFSSSHLFGFFSVFNADAVKDVKIYKGGIPAYYGGRLSSVLDVRQKEGNIKEFGGEGGIGLISSRLLIEGPIKKDKSSFMIAGRRSYFELFTKMSPDEDLQNSTLYFYDLNAKVNYIINDKNRVFLSGYFGRDVFGVRELGSEWGNATATLRWNHVINSKLFSNFTVVYSNYQYNLGFETDTDNFDWVSNIENTNAKADFSYYLNPDNTLEFGVNALYYKFRPGNVELTRLNEEDVFFDLESERALEPAVYLSNEQKISDRLSLQYGLRYSWFYNIGKGSVYQYSGEQPIHRDYITDTLYYGSGEIIESYDALEPRISGKFTLTPGSSIKASYNRMAQYLHLISNTTAASPFDVWTPAGPFVKPARVDQFTLGYFKNFRDNTIEFSAEVYYKNYQDLLDYKDGAQLLANETLETELLSGKGRAYGLELLLRKQKGRLTGWIGYTLSRTERQVDGINNDKYYPSNYDKPHDITVVASYELSQKWTISSNLSIMSGRPITYPNAKWEFDSISVPNYDNRNGARTPAYHRLDISATYEKPKKPGRRWQSSWSFGLYNAYARRNAYSIFFRQNEDNPAVTEAVRLSIFGTVIPYATYNFKF